MMNVMIRTGWNIYTCQIRSIIICRKEISIQTTFMPVIYSNCSAVVRVTAPVFPSLLFPSDRSVNHEAAAWNSQGGTCPSPSSQQTLLVSVCPSTDGWRTASDGGRFWFPQTVTNRQMHSAASSGAAEPTGSADEIVKNNPPRIVSHSSFHCSENAPPADKVDWSLLNNLAYVNVRMSTWAV